MRSRRRHRQNAGLTSWAVSLADASPRTDETAHRYLHFQRCLAGCYPYRVSARPVRYFAGRGYHHRTHHSRCPQGQRAFVCDARLAERASLVQPSRERQTNSLNIAAQFGHGSYSGAFRYDRYRISVPRSARRRLFHAFGLPLSAISARFHEARYPNLQPHYLLADAAHRMEKSATFASKLSGVGGG